MKSAAAPQRTTSAKKCRHCSARFTRSVGRQIYCTKPACVKERRYEYWKAYVGSWKKKHPGYWQSYLKKWRREHPGYFAQWRRKHPDYFKNLYRARKAGLSKKA